MSQILIIADSISIPKSPKRRYLGPNCTIIKQKPLGFHFVLFGAGEENVVEN